MYIYVHMYLSILRYICSFFSYGLTRREYTCGKKAPYQSTLLQNMILRSLCTPEKPPCC